MLKLSHNLNNDNNNNAIIRLIKPYDISSCDYYKALLMVRLLDDDIYNKYFIVNFDSKKLIRNLLNHYIITDGEKYSYIISIKSDFSLAIIDESMTIDISKNDILKHL